MVGDHAALLVLLLWALVGVVDVVDVVCGHEVELDAVGVGGLRGEEVADGVAEVEHDHLEVVAEPGRDDDRDGVSRVIIEKSGSVSD